MKGFTVYQGFWRETARPLRIGPFSAHAALPALLFILHMRMWTFVTLVVVMFALKALEGRGYTLPVAMQALKLRVFGKTLPRRRMAFKKTINR